MKMSAFCVFPHHPWFDHRIFLTVLVSMDIVVQPAVSWMKLNEDIKSTGLFFPVDPGPTVRTVRHGQSEQF